MENNRIKRGDEPGPMPVGRWTINQSKCTTCCECVDACGRGLLYFDNKNKVICIREENNCDQCGDCASVCSYRAIVLT